ncbi:MAG: FAD-dependent oxidoreductase [Blastocatellia bacterium]|nr:FAD-dependent oxidoreductase [Blastocatellia bacterium]
MTKDYTTDIAVVGAGVFGAWTAYQLRRAGAKVLLIDAYGPANSRASSGGESSDNAQVEPRFALATKEKVQQRKVY